MSQLNADSARVTIGQCRKCRKLFQTGDAVYSFPEGSICSRCITMSSPLAQQIAKAGVFVAAEDGPPESWSRETKRRVEKTQRKLQK